MVSTVLPLLRGRAATGTPQPTITPWLHIASDDSVTVMIPSAEMGQGITTSLPMLIAEELEVDWRKVRFEAAPADPAYANPIFHMQATGGSTSIRAFYTPLREVGAAARMMLCQAAAEKWGVPLSECNAANGRISHPSGKSESYGALADAASKLPIPTNLQLKARSNWRILGKPTARLDTPLKVDGSAQFGIDVRVPDMLVGTIAASPVFGGKLKSVDDTPALRVKGVRAVVRLADAVAVLGEGYWPCKKGLEALSPQWEEGPNANLDSERIATMLNDGFNEDGAVAEIQGDPATALQQAAKTVEAIYTLPFLAHATMEPMNATARVTADLCEIWAPTQAQGPTQHELAQLLGLRPEQVKINTTYLGGGFGRRFERDFIIQTVLVARQVGRPVKLIWAREEDIQHDFYRPVSTAGLRAGLDAAGRVTAWDFRIVAPSIMTRALPQRVKNGIDPSSVEGTVG